MNTVVVTVTYNPDLILLKKQLVQLGGDCKVVLVDNSPTEDIANKIVELKTSFPNTHLITFGKNTGIAFAQNMGVRYIIKKYPNIKFVLFLDQDSIPKSDMITILEQELARLTIEGNRVGAIGPALYDPRDGNLLGFHIIKGILWSKVVPSDEIPTAVAVNSLNSSGSLIPIESLKKVGFFDSSLFIDHVETEWCFRCQAYGFKIFGTQATTMEHRMGDDVCNYWFFGYRRMPYRKPRRNYYITRNSLILQKLSYVPKVWKFWNLLKIIFTFFYFGFISKDANQQRYWIFRGIRDGWNCNKDILE